MSTTTAVTIRPRVPKELYARSTPRLWLSLVYSVSLWLGASFVTWWLWQSAWPLWVKGLASLPLLLAGGQGLVIAGYLGHDAFHFNLHENRVVSCVIGIIATAPLFPFVEIGFAISHWNHHLHANEVGDPDGQIFGKFNSWPTRIFLARPLTFLVYGRNALYLAMGKPLKFKAPFPLKPEVVRRLAQFNFLVVGWMTTVHLYLIFNYLSFYFCLLGVRLSSVVLSGMNPYFEHAGTGHGLGADSRSRVGWLWDLFFLGSNYHLEHHLYPGIPFYNLKRTNRYLNEIGYYRSPHPVAKGIAVFRYLSGAYAYPRRAV
ncbi:MAG: fatty acid desaturase [Bdellovibrionales bacterium]|nr:fatty acid desaturase [Bdellovibrionales bacterium]